MIDSILSNKQLFSNEFARLIINNAKAIILVLDADGKIVFFNNYLENLTGYKLDDMIGADWFEKFLPGQEDKYVKGLFYKAMHSNKPRGSINPIQTINGDIKIIEWHDITLTDKELQIKGLLAIGIDITTRRKAEEELRKYKNHLEDLIATRTKDLIKLNQQLKNEVLEKKSAEKELEKTTHFLEELIDNLPVGIFTKDGKSRRITYYNKASEDISGLPKEYVIGKTDFDFLPEAKATYYNELDNKAFQEKQLIEILDEEKVNANGEKVFLYTKKVPLFDENGNPDFLIGITEDITERKNAEQALRESEEMYRALIEQSQDVIFIFNSEKPIFINSRAEIISGYPLEYFYNHSLLDFVFPDDLHLAKELFKEAAAGHDLPQAIEIRILTKDKKIKHLEFTSCKIIYKGKVAFLASGRNITEKRQMEEEIQKKQKLESVGILAGGIAHDFNNILTAVLGSITLARMKYAQGEEASSFLVDAEKALDRAKSLTNQLLTFAQGGAPVKETSSIHELIQDSADFVLRGSNVSCKYKLPNDLWFCNIDKGQISQVIQNLVINAMQAMPDGGLIEIEGKNTPGFSPPASQKAAGQFIEISVKDNGIGISDKFLKKIFDPYFSTKHHGSGLGLSIVYSIINKHDGYIEVESEVDSGTKFKIYLPAAPMKVKASKENSDSISKGTGKILVMDDDDLVRNIARDLLTHLGYEAECAIDGNETIEKYSKALSANTPYDIVIMDLTIPGSMGGKEAIIKLLGIDPNVKAIVSSGYSNDPVMANYADYGFSGILSKPFRMDQLSQVIEKLLSSKNYDSSFSS